MRTRRQKVERTTITGAAGNGEQERALALCDKEGLRVVVCGAVGWAKVPGRRYRVASRFKIVAERVVT